MVKIGRRVGPITAAAFDANGELKPDYVQIQDPTNDNCAQCHGVVHTDREDPLTLAACDSTSSQTATTGQVISSQRISEFGAEPGRQRQTCPAPGISTPSAA